jgi:hypothetical protein
VQCSLLIHTSGVVPTGEMDKVNFVLIILNCPAICYDYQTENGNKINVYILQILQFYTKKPRRDICM